MFFIIVVSNKHKLQFSRLSKYGGLAFPLLGSKNIFRNKLKTVTFQQNPEGG
ncbi:hypothetical protein MOUN0_F04038 [Monosporozyma unispora]